MFGNIRVKSSKSSSTYKKAPSKSRIPFVRVFVDKFYRDPYRFGVLKCVGFFAIGVYVARVLSDLDILPTEPSQAISPPSPY